MCILQLVATVDLLLSNYGELVITIYNFWLKNIVFRKVNDWWAAICIDWPKSLSEKIAHKLLRDGSHFYRLSFYLVHLVIVITACTIDISFSDSVVDITK